MINLSPGQSAAQVPGTGAVVSIGGLTGTAAASTYVVIAEVADVSFSGRKRAVVQATNFDSLGVAQKLGTILDLGSVSFTVMRVSNDPGQLAVIAANLANGNYNFKIQMPINTLVGQTTSGDVILFSGIVTGGGSFDVTIDKPSEYKFEVDLSAYTVTAGS